MDKISRLSRRLSVIRDREKLLKEEKIKILRKLADEIVTKYPPEVAKNEG